MSDSPFPLKAPPLVRLQASRERLRDAMTPPPAAPPPARPPLGSVQRWLQSLRMVPVVGEVAGSLGDWWVRHPFRPVAKLAGDASTAAVTPVAQRHPLALVGASAAFGAVLVWAGPWKWALRTVLYAGLVPQLASKIVSKLPIQSWLSLLGTVVAARRKTVEPSIVTVSAPATSKVVSGSLPVAGPGSPARAPVAVPPAR